MLVKNKEANQGGNKNFITYQFRVTLEQEK